MDEHEYEDRLEPRHLIRRSHVVLRAGTLMLGAGTSSLRVREVMTAVARTVGIEHLHAQVTFATIVLTVGRRGIFRTQVAETRPSVNADRIAMLQRFAHDLPARATVASPTCCPFRLKSSSPASMPSCSAIRPASCRQPSGC